MCLNKFIGLINLKLQFSTFDISIVYQLFVHDINKLTKLITLDPY